MVPKYWSRDVVGAFSDAWRRITGMKHDVVCEGGQVIMPVYDVLTLVSRHLLRAALVAVTATGTFDLTSVLKEEDFIIKAGYLFVSSGTFTFTYLQMDDGKGNVATLYNMATGTSLNFASVFPNGLRVPAGCKLKVVVDTKAVNGNIGFDGQFYFMPAVVPQ